MSESQEYKYIGQRTIRPDGFDKVTGRADFGADLSLPGMIWGKILRSPHAHARIKNIDTSKAEAHPDVMAVVTHQDFPAVSAGGFAVGEGQVDFKETSWPMIRCSTTDMPLLPLQQNLRQLLRQHCR